ncbi:MAG: hypothetical protein V3U63_07385 [Gemmatimonadota bacterium]
MRMAALGFAFASFSFAAFLGGCTAIPARGPSSEELSAIRSQKAAVVLLRVTATEDGKALNTSAGGWSYAYIGVQAVKIGEQGSFVPWTMNRAPSSNAGREGWRYLVLATGTYYLSINTPHSGRNTWRSADRANRAPRFWLNVPGNQPVVYAGSIHVSCSTHWQGSSESACSSDIVVTDETESAAALARASFADYGPLTTALMQRYGDPVKPALLHDLKPVTLATAGREELVSPDWWKRSAKRFLGWYSESPVSGSGCAGGYGCAAALMLYLAYLPFGAAIAGADASSAESKWGPCMQNLAQQLRELDPMAQLHRRLKEKLGRHGVSVAGGLANRADLAPVAAREGFKSVLQVEIQRVQMRECEERGAFCLEVAVRARLMDVRTNQPVYDTVFVYSNPSRRGVGRSTLPADYEFLPTAFAKCREMAAYCGESGRKLFKQELARALDLLVDSILPETASVGD